ncbi:hypothetical protein BDF22DRAFT_662732 [Syncephalis plumigaleata]|nr:hypothetical protein BDF22DRAFT_662732 [Syncephalis plumigaleata]
MSTTKRGNDINDERHTCKHRRLGESRAVLSLTKCCLMILPRLSVRSLLNALRQLPNHLVNIAVVHISHLQLLVLTDILKSSVYASSDESDAHPTEYDIELCRQLEKEGETRMLVRKVEHAWLSIRKQSKIVAGLGSIKEAELANLSTMCFVHSILNPLCEANTSKCGLYTEHDTSLTGPEELFNFWYRWNCWDNAPLFEVYYGDHNTLDNMTTSASASPLLCLFRCILSNVRLMDLKGSNEFVAPVELLPWMTGTRHLALTDMNHHQQGFSQLPLVYQSIQEHSIQKIVWLRSDFALDQFITSTPRVDHKPIDLYFLRCTFLFLQSSPIIRGNRWRIRTLTLDEVELDRSSTQTSLNTTPAYNPFLWLISSFDTEYLDKLTLDTMMLHSAHSTFLRESLKCGLRSLEFKTVFFDESTSYDWLEECFREAHQLESLKLYEIKEMITSNSTNKHYKDLLVHCRSLKDLCISKCDLHGRNLSETLSTISTLPNLTSLVFTWQHLGEDDDIQSVLKLLHLPKLRSLTINFAIQRSTQVITELFKQLPLVDTLEQLDISESLIDDRLIDAFVEVLANHQLSLMQVDLSHNHITETGVRKIADAIRKGRQLDTFRLLLDYNRVSPQFISSLHLPQLVATNWYTSAYRDIFDGFDEM